MKTQTNGGHKGMNKCFCFPFWQVPSIEEFPLHLRAFRFKKRMLSFSVRKELIWDLTDCTSPPQEKPLSALLSTLTQILNMAGILAFKLVLVVSRKRSKIYLIRSLTCKSHKCCNQQIKQTSNEIYFPFCFSTWFFHVRIKQTSLGRGIDIRSRTE